MRRFRDLPVERKIRTITLMLAFSFILAILFFGVFYYARETRYTVKQEGRTLTESLASSIDRAIYNINENFVFTFGTTEFTSELYLIYRNSTSDIELRTMLQDELEKLQQSNYLIDSVFFIRSDRSTFYTLMNQSVTETGRDFISEAEYDGIEGITFLSSRTSPISWAGEGIPIVYPIRYNYGTEIVLDDNSNACFIVVMMSTERLQSILNPASQLSAHSMVLSYGDSVLLGDIGSRSLNFSTELPLSGLTLSDYIDDSYMARSILLITLLPSLLIILLATVIISISRHILNKYVTKPVTELEKAVTEIGNGHYSYSADIEAEDELGNLSKSITRMGMTIGEQIEKIRQDEDEKYKMEIRLLSEQLRPHFLYNTLECIQQEVKTGNNESAAQTVRDLSLYLRTALSYGKETISIEDEVKHDLSYVRIMNSRFSKNIILSHRIERGLENLQIPKSLLQPFIENSIKHGFSVPVESPLIEIMFARTGENTLTMSVSDNGTGFDTEAFMEIMTSDYGEDGHVGIRNVYKRLIARYGDGGFEITADSAPFFRSTITIIIPMD